MKYKERNKINNNKKQRNLHKKRNKFNKSHKLTHKLTK